MDWFGIVGALAFFTLGTVAVLAFVNAQKTKERKEDPNAPKSTLAKDTDSKGDPADV